ncbi:hypothetical protein DFJ73DRAFT_165280 [Zopfochytrium polystomum]|nr:hypothetical protein DFJ73DRAFT_165280 [Zopfochytrium polystomum]
MADNQSPAERTCAVNVERAAPPRPAAPSPMSDGAQRPTGATTTAQQTPCALPQAAPTQHAFPHQGDPLGELNPPVLPASNDGTSGSVPDRGSDDEKEAVNNMRAAIARIRGTTDQVLRIMQQLADIAQGELSLDEEQRRTFDTCQALIANLERGVSEMEEDWDKIEAMKKGGKSK